jgi:nicotinate phosphoribosyltransferase
MGVSKDAPALDVAYKLTAYAGLGRLKLSSGKSTLPCRKQVFRRFENGHAVGDTIAELGETQEGTPLLEPLMKEGERIGPGRESLRESKERAEHRIAQLPPALRRLGPADPPYSIEVSDALESRKQEVIDRIRTYNELP